MELESRVAARPAGTQRPVAQSTPWRLVVVGDVTGIPGQSQGVIRLVTTTVITVAAELVNRLVVVRTP